MSSHDVKEENGNNKDQNDDKGIVELNYDDIYDPKYQQGQSSSLLIEILKNISPSQDLLRLSLPSFILEKRSLLEKFSDFMHYQSLILNVHVMADPEQRFLAIVRFYLSCWNRIPKSGVAKPYNPILGEVFKCVWKYQTSETHFIAEQVSHHPPVSAFYIRNKNKNLLCFGHICCRASLSILGNSAGTYMEGPLTFRICNLNEDYTMTYPCVGVKGIFYGAMVMENQGESSIECKKTGFRATFQWQRDRQVLGEIFYKEENVYTIQGDYTSVVTIKHNTKKKVFPFFEISKLIPAKKTVDKVKDQDPMESRRVWLKLTEQLQMLNYEKATEAKNQIEEEQRALRKTEQHKHHTPKFFVLDNKGNYIYKDFE